jgi:TonB family protein
MSGAVAVSRTRRGRATTGRALFALALALSVHALVLWGSRYVDLVDEAALAEARARTIAQGNAEERPLEISSLVDSLAEPDRPTPAEEKKQEQAKKEQESKDPHGQVVDLARPAIEERPDEARFVSEYDSKVDRERRGKTGRDQAGAAVAPTPAPTAPPPGAARAEEASRGGKLGRPDGPKPAIAMVRPNQLGHDGHEADADGTFKRHTGAGNDGAEHPAAPQPPTGTTAPTGGQRGEDGDGRARSPGAQAGAPKPNLLAPGREVLERAIGAGQGSMDYLKDIEDGDATALNAKKWKHAPFFNRLKRAVAQEWHPDMVYVHHDPSGNIYGVKDRVTVLRVSLRPDGGLIGSNVIQSSGIDFLDDEAIEAFRRAQPFQNPPKDLADGDGQIHFSFAFIFELSGRTSFKVYKYK